MSSQCKCSTKIGYFQSQFDKTNKCQTLKHIDRPALLVFLRLVCLYVSPSEIYRRSNCCIQRSESYPGITWSASWPRTTTASLQPYPCLTTVAATPSVPSSPLAWTASRWTSWWTLTATWWPTSPGSAISPHPRADTT